MAVLFVVEEYLLKHTTYMLKRYTS